MNNNVVNLISFLKILVPSMVEDLEKLKKLGTEMSQEDLAMVVVAMIPGAPALCNSLTSIARGKHRGEDVVVGYCDKLKIDLLKMSVKSVLSNSSQDFNASFVNSSILLQDNRGMIVMNKSMERAVKDGEFYQMQLFGQALYKHVKTLVPLVADGTISELSPRWEEQKELFDWWCNSKELVTKGLAVANNGTRFILVKKEVMPMPERLPVTQEGLTEVARLLTKVVTPASTLSNFPKGEEDVINFFLKGMFGLSKECLAKHNASESDMSYADYRIGSIAKMFVSHWAGGEQEAITVLKMLTGYASADSSGLVRSLRAIVRGAHDLGIDARSGKKPELHPVFKLGTMPNGVPCVWVYRNSEWTMVVTDECKRLRKTVITEESFLQAMETPSIVCQYAGQKMLVMTSLTSYNTAKSDSNKGGNLLINRLLSSVGLRKFEVIPTFNAKSTSDKDKTRWLRFMELPNLYFNTRRDHMSVEISTGRVNRTLIHEEFDNILVVANILSRAQYSNSTRELCGETQLPMNLRHSGDRNGRLKRLFPKVTKSGISIPGDLLTLAGRLFEDIMNPRWANGITCTIIGDPRLDPGECLMPAYAKPAVDRVGTEYVKVVKMPNYMAFELHIKGYAIDNVMHISPALASLANADFDGDQMAIQPTITVAPMLSPSSQGGHYLRTYKREPAIVGIPAVQKPDHETDFYNIFAGKALIGVAVEFWRQAMQAIKEINPFELEYVRNAFVVHNDSICRLLKANGYAEFVTDGKADWEMFMNEFPLGRKCDNFADLTASIFFELIMPKTKFDKEALEVLSRMGIDPKAMKTLEGQLEVMATVADNPMGTLEVFMTLDNKLIKRWLPRVIMSMLALHRVCNDRGLTVKELVDSAPAGGLYHQSKSRWSKGMPNIVNHAITGGFDAIRNDSIPVELTESKVSLPSQEEEEEQGNKFFGKKKNDFNQVELTRKLQLAGESHNSRMSHSNSISYLPTIYALEMFKLYVEAADEIKLSIITDDSTGCYALMTEFNPVSKTGGVVYMEGILQRIGGQPKEEFAELYYMDILCPTCGSIYGYCEHSYCERCKRPIGTCKCTGPNDITYQKVTGKLEPKKALAWLLTRPDLGQSQQVRPGVDTILASLRETLTSNDARSNGDRFNRFMTQFMRRLAYKPGGNVSLELRRWAKDHGHNLNMVALEWPICPKESCLASHPAYASVESSKFAIELAKKYSLCPTATSNSVPGNWMDHNAVGKHYAAFPDMIDPGHAYSNTSKRGPVINRFKQSMPIISGGTIIPVAWEGIPTNILPQVFAPATAFYSMNTREGDADWNDLDQLAFTYDYLDSISVDRPKDIRVKQGFIVHVDNKLALFTLKSREGEYHGSHTLITDPTGRIEPTIITEVGNATYIVEFIGKFEETPDGFIALEDASISLHTETGGCTGMKVVDPFGNKGICVAIQDLTPDRFIMLGDNHPIKVDCYLSPDRFSENKMQAGASIVNAINTQAGKLRQLSGVQSPDEPLRIPTDIPKEEMLEFSLMYLQSELESLDDKSPELTEKLESVAAALEEATTMEERVKALWPLAFHPMYEVVDGEYVHVSDVMLSYHPLAVQDLFPQGNCTIPVSHRSDSLLKFNQNDGVPSLNIPVPNSKSGLSLRRNYSDMTIGRCPELSEELYGHAETFKYDSAKLYLWEQIMSCALQHNVVAFPELGPVVKPLVTRIMPDTKESDAEEIVTLVYNEESTDDLGFDYDCITVVTD